MFLQFAQFIIAGFSINITIGILLDALTALLYVLIFNMFFFNPKEVSRVVIIIEKSDFHIRFLHIFETSSNLNFSLYS